MLPLPPEEPESQPKVPAVNAIANNSPAARNRVTIDLAPLRFRDFT
jgi:hypothetical protein